MVNTSKKVAGKIVERIQFSGRGSRSGRPTHRRCSSASAVTESVSMVMLTPQSRAGHSVGSGRATHQEVSMLQASKRPSSVPSNEYCRVHATGRGRTRPVHLGRSRRVQPAGVRRNLFERTLDQILAFPCCRPRQVVDRTIQQIIGVSQPQFQKQRSSCAPQSSTSACRHSRVRWFGRCCW